MQWQPIAAVLLTPYLMGNVVASLLLTTSWLTQFTSPPSSRESTISPMGGKPQLSLCSYHMTSKDTRPGSLVVDSAMGKTQKHDWRMWQFLACIWS